MMDPSFYLAGKGCLGTKKNGHRPVGLMSLITPSLLVLSVWAGEIRTLALIRQISYLMQAWPLID